MKLSNKVYDVLKWMALLALPALGTLVFTLSSIWGWEYGDKINGTISAVGVFIGAVIGIASAKYKKEDTE